MSEKKSLSGRYRRRSSETLPEERLYSIEGGITATSRKMNETSRDVVKASCLAPDSANSIIYPTGSFNLVIPRSLLRGRALYKQGGWKKGRTEAV